MPGMNLREVVETYRKLAGGFARPLSLSAFGLSSEDTEQSFSLFDEDYHISRFFHFTLEPGAEQTFRINGFAQSHVALDPEITTIL